MRILLAMVLLSLSTGCGAVAGSNGATTPMDAATLLATIATLTGTRPFSGSAVARVVNVKLSDTPQSNTWFKVLRSQPGAGGFDKVEVREPTSQSPGKGGMVLLELSSPCVTRVDVGDRFGAPEPAPPSPPNPHAPPDSPEYDIHRQSWGALKLGYKPSSGCLVSVVLDADS